MLAIVGGRPRVLSLPEVLENFIDFRRDVVRRRMEFDLKKAQARAHILEGLKIALDSLDAIIKLIRGSKTPAEARGGLIENFSLTQLQAQAILDMQLQRLTGLERQKIIDEMAELLKTIEKLRAILDSELLLRQKVVEELQAISEKHGDDRRTEVIDVSDEIRVEDLIAEEDVAITVTNTGYIKRTAIDTYRHQRRGGKGRIGMRTRGEDFVTQLFIASTHAYILIFSTRGRVYWLKVHEIHDIGPGGKGKAIANLVSLAADEQIAALVAVREWPQVEGERFLVMGTRRGVIKKTDLVAFCNPRAGGIIAQGVGDDDSVIAVELTDGKRDILLATRKGMAIRFPETGVRAMGRTASGVRGIKLREGDEVVAMVEIQPNGALMTVCENGYGKRTDIEDYPQKSRGGVGVISIQVTKRNGPVVSAVAVENDDEIMLISGQGTLIRTPVKDISVFGRNTQGVRLVNLSELEQLASIERIIEYSDN